MDQFVLIQLVGNKIRYRKADGTGNQRFITVKQNEDITWRCNEYNWALEFYGETPLPGPEPHKLYGLPEKPETRKAVGRPRHKYKYLVAVWDHNNNRIFTDDPEVDVEEDG